MTEVTLIDDRELAIAAGWNVKQKKEDYWEIYQGDRVVEYMGSEAVAWQVLLYRAPQWKKSLDAAMSLPFPPGNAKVMREGNLFSLSHYCSVEMFDGYQVFKSDIFETLTEALCHVFLLWWRYQQERKR